MNRHSTFLYLIYCMGLLSFLFSCKTDAKFAPQAPDEQYNQSQPVLQRQISTVNIPVEIPLVELEKAMNAQVQGLLYEDNSLEDNNKDNLMLKVWKRQDIKIDAAGDLFSIRVPIRIWAKVGYGFDRFGVKMYDYRETDFEMDVKFVSQVLVSPEWQIYTKTSPNGYEWVKKPYIKVGPVEIPVSPIVGRIVDEQQETIAQDLDAQVKKALPLKQYVQQAWTLMQAPMQVSEEYNTWFKVTPTEVIMSPLITQNRKVRALIGVKGYTETFMGRKPEASAVALPPLQVAQQVPDDFVIGVSGEVSHEYATQLVAKQFVNQTFKNGKYQVTVTSIDLYGNGDNLIIKAGLTGSINGMVYLRGKPFYDPATQTVSLQNLDYDLDSKNKLIKTASWLLHGTFVRKISEAFKIPVGDQLAEARKMLQAQLVNNQVAKGIYLNGKIDEFTPASVIITPQSIVAVLLAKGKVDVKIAGLL